MPSISGVCESYYQSDGSTNLFEKQFDVCVFSRFPKQTLCFTNSLKYIDWTP